MYKDHGRPIRIRLGIQKQGRLNDRCMWYGIANLFQKLHGTMAVFRVGASDGDWIVPKKRAIVAEPC